VSARSVSARRVGGSKKMEFEVMEGQECRALHILSWCLSNANIESEPGGVVGLSGSGKRIRRPSCRAGTPSAKVTPQAGMGASW
jgi:hypothetical protein